MLKQTYVSILLVVFFICFALSAIRPHDYFTWLLEVLPGIFLILVLIGTYRSFQFTSMTYTFIWLHMLILMIGGHYTYAEVPLFNWIQHEWGLDRNYYDRLGHFAQGFVPALMAREVLRRHVGVTKRGWLAVLVVSVCLAFSAFYELLEFLVARLTGTAAEAFLGTQGDVWDTQWDMTLALIGAIAALFFSRIQDNAMKQQN